MSDNPQSPSGAAPGTAGCVCGGAGPVLTDFLRRLGPSEPVKRHFDQARLELLKGLRALIDERIESISRQEPKGTKVTVE